MKWMAGLAVWIFALVVQASPVEVRLEPFPPLVYEDGSGLMVEMLHEAAREAGLTLAVEVMPYSRAKYQLRNGQADLVGPVPLDRETREFYQYAVELDWRVPTKADLFSYAPDALRKEKWRQGSIGTPLGNADFFSGITGLPLDSFLEASLVELVKMLNSERIPVVLFERASTMTTMQNMEAGHFFYRNLFSIPAGFAVADTERGRALKASLDAHMRPPAELRSFAPYLRYLSLPDRGMVPRQAVGPPVP
jgi:polar amino acid transport system substrate-binding protein